MRAVSSACTKICCTLRGDRENLFRVACLSGVRAFDLLILLFGLCSCVPFITGAVTAQVTRSWKLARATGGKTPHSSLPTGCDCCGASAWAYLFSDKEVDLGRCGQCGLHYVDRLE